ncbi:MAG: hypothetical protein ACJ75B_07745 [Flavisolibacter sp.]
MKSDFWKKRMMPIGFLICVSPSLIVRFWDMPDFLNGFVRGIGLALMLLSFHPKFKIKRLTETESERERV